MQIYCTYTNLTFWCCVQPISRRPNRQLRKGLGMLSMGIYLDSGLVICKSLPSGERAVYDTPNLISNPTGDAYVSTFFRNFYPMPDYTLTRNWKL
jgi:hypothetical protein